jgi:hypothetical protein
MGLKVLRAFSSGIVWGIVMLAIGLCSGCGNGEDAGNSDGRLSGRISDDNTVADVQGEIDPKWPDDKLPKSVLPIAGAKVLSSMQDGDDIGVVFMCKRSTIEDYIQQLEQIGWSIDEDMGSDGNDELGAISRFLSNDEGEHLQLSWQSGGGTGTLGYSKK